MNSHELEMETSTPEKALHFAIEVGLLPKSVICPSCGKTITNHTSPNATTTTRRFECANGHPRNSIKVSQAETKCSKATVSEWYKKARTVCLLHSINNTVKIGGPGIVVEVDEMLMIKSKSFRGKEYTGYWMIGGVVKNQPDQFFFEMVDSRTQSSTRDVIMRHIEPGSIIHTDGWRETELAFPRLEDPPIRTDKNTRTTIDSDFHILKERFPDNQIWDVQRDGNCWIWAILVQLVKNGGSEFSPKSRDDYLACMLQIRGRTAETLIEHKGQFEDSLADLGGETEWDDFVERTRTSGKDGGQIELEALAMTLDLTITVENARNRQRIIIGNGEIDVHVGYLCWMHYVAILEN
ncbi:hypothetical protein BLNAU_3235 [Blattamonas nauphoetae]|uniref:OTU domain-containing protein n=1 Tax=Blattamonas nauphoetae TaxID=2049346 RepID=A0ABQ9YDG0_9EUKA|nr:hypothetical protein BLNAU_3235 [Blattamonas nauphoetae]